MFYLVAIIGILYLLAGRSSGSSNPQVMAQQQPSNNVTPAISGAAIYVPTANGTPGKVVAGPTGVYGTLGVSQSEIAVAVAPVPNPAMIITDPLQQRANVTALRQRQDRPILIY